MEIKVISDGTPRGTSVINKETGEPIDRVTEVTWHCSATDSMATVELKLLNVEVQVVGKAALAETK